MQIQKQLHWSRPKRYSIQSKRTLMRSTLAVKMKTVAWTYDNAQLSNCKYGYMICDTCKIQTYHDRNGPSDWNGYGSTIQGENKIYDQKQKSRISHFINLFKKFAV
ncbi:hypothetical protein Trydic_g5996 [Trypoxylus dichotomus]